MRTLHAYLTRQVLITFMMTVAVFTFVLLLGNVLKEVLALLVSRQVELGTVLRGVVLLIPYAFAFALPMGLLTATLLVFGRLSADQELTAIRSSGVSLVALVSPVLLLSLALSGFSAFINLQVAPRCRLAYKSLLSQAGARNIMSFLPEKTFIRDFKGFIIYLGTVKRTNLTDVLIYVLDDQGNLKQFIRADTGQVSIDPDYRSFSALLFHAWSLDPTSGQWIAGYSSEMPVGPILLNRERENRISLGEMTVTQMFAELHDLEKRVNAALPLEKVLPDDVHGRKKSMPHSLEDLTTPLKVHIHEQVSFSFACLGFALVGIPLGIRSHRRETTFGIALALVLILIYYSFFIVGQTLDTRPEWGPQLILWLPNFVFQAIGSVLLWRANRGI
jgi:lipopolysaccharide export system permease protein